MLPLAWLPDFPTTLGEPPWLSKYFILNIAQRGPARWRGATPWHF